MTPESITLGAGLIFIFIAIVGGGITGEKTNIPVIRTSGRLALGFIGLLLCLPFVVGRVQWAGAVPRGTIVAWYTNDKNAKPPDGWAICDGSWGAAQRPVPNLNGLFIRGTTNISETGNSGGALTHKHSVRGDGSNSDPGNMVSGLHGAERATSDDASNLPPYMSIVYIMKL